MAKLERTPSLRPKPNYFPDAFPMAFGCCSASDASPISIRRQPDCRAAHLLLIYCLLDQLNHGLPTLKLEEP